MAESPLHKDFKHLLQTRIQDCLNSRQPLSLQWDCLHCSEKHQGNLLKKAAKISLETKIGNYRPDLALWDSQGNAIAVIEIIFRHFPNSKAIAYWQKNKIILINFVLKDHSCLQRVSSKILQPDFVDLCLHPKCNRCGKHLYKRKLLIIKAPCWRCHTTMKIAAVQRDYLDCGDFEIADIAIAKNHGCYLAYCYSSIINRSYLASVCQKCKAFVGKNFLFSNYVAIESYPKIILDTGYFCPRCEFD